MKLKFTLLGYEIAAWELEDLQQKADVVEAAVNVTEKIGTKLAGKVVDGFSKQWMKAWVGK